MKSSATTANATPLRGGYAPGLARATISFVSLARTATADTGRRQRHMGFLGFLRPASIIVRLLLPAAVAAAGFSLPAAADEIYLSENDAPTAVFPDADRFERHDMTASPELHELISRRSGRVQPSYWEASYPVFSAWKEGKLLGRAVIVEEVGKHRNITFIVGVSPDSSVAGVAIMTYREAYGAEVRSRRFLAQYRGKGNDDPLMPGRDIRYISGATLSFQAIGRGIRKAIAVADTVAAQATGQETGDESSE